MKVLIAYDGSPAADAAVQEALRMTWPAGSEIRLVTVVEWPVALEPPFPTDYAGPAVERVREMLTQKAKQTLERALQEFSARPNLDVTSDLREGSPKHALLEAIEQWKPDLVMTGSTGKSGLRGLLLGSVCHALVTHAPCSVQVIKLPASGKK